MVATMENVALGPITTQSVDDYRGGPVTREPKTGRLAAGSGLTDKQKIFVTKFVALGGDGARAAEAADYSEPHIAAWRLLRQPHIAEAIRKERAVSIETEGASIAWATMRAIMQEPQYSGAVKFQAAKWTLENSGHGLAAQRAQLGLPSDKPLSEMNLQELEAFITAGGVALQALQQQRANTIDITPVAHDIAREDEPSA